VADSLHYKLHSLRMQCKGHACPPPLPVALQNLVPFILSPAPHSLALLPLAFRLLEASLPLALTCLTRREQTAYRHVPASELLGLLTDISLVCPALLSL